MAKNKELTLEEKLKEALIPKEEQPYEIPESWEWVKLGSISKTISKGTTPRGGEASYRNTGVKFLRVENIRNDYKLNLSNIKFIDDYTHNNFLKRSILMEHDVLISIAGSLGRTAVVKNEDIPMNINQAICFIRLINSNEISSKFFCLLFNNSIIKLKLLEKTKTTAIPNLTLEIISNSSVPLPPLEEQKRIVEKLDSMFKKINKAKEAIQEVKENIENRKESILNKAFRGELTAEWRKNNQTEDAIELLKSINDEKMRNWKQECIEAERNGKKKPSKPKIEEIENIIISKEEEPYEIPKNWEWVKLGSIGEYKKGPFGSSLTKSIFVSKGENTIKVYEQKNAIQKNWKLGNYYISEKYFKENMTSFEVKANDIIVSCAGTIGESYIMPLEIEKGIINQALMKIRLFSDIDYKYFLKYFDYILKKMSNSYSKGSAIKNIPPFKIFKLLPFALPPLKEQEEIVRILDEILEKESKIKELIKLEETIELLEKSILDKVFRGKLGTQNKDDEPAIELLKKIL